MMNAANSEGENDLHSNDEEAVGQASISLILPTCNLTLHRKLTFLAPYEESECMLESLAASTYHALLLLQFIRS